MKPRDFTVRRARTDDVTPIRHLIDLYAEKSILLDKPTVTLYEDIQEFWVAERDADGEVVGCGALHVFWLDLAEVRTVVVHPECRGMGVGAGILDKLVRTAARIGVRRLFCLTFEVDFFAAHGFPEISGVPVPPADRGRTVEVTGRRGGRVPRSGAGQTQHSGQYPDASDLVTGFGANRGGHQRRQVDCQVDSQLGRQVLVKSGGGFDFLSDLRFADFSISPYWRKAGQPMAKHTTVVIHDDLDGSAGASTVKFGLDGKTYEIDLSPKHEEELRGALQKFLDKASAVTGYGASAPARRKYGTGPVRRDTKHIRDWLRANGTEISDRGRIPIADMARYDAAHPGRDGRRRRPRRSDVSGAAGHPARYAPRG